MQRASLRPESAGHLDCDCQRQQFWSGSASQAVVELFRRHVTTGTTFGELGPILARWLDDDDVRLVDDVGGRTLPVTSTSPKRQRSSSCSTRRSRCWSRHPPGRSWPVRLRRRAAWVRVAEEDGLVFIYNVTEVDAKMRRALNRERSSVGRSAYTDRVKAVLLAVEDPAVLTQLFADMAGLACE
jgi:hypothetical protein